MDIYAIFGLQFALSTVVFAVLAWVLVTHWLEELPLKTALTILIAPHAFRHIGMSFLVPALNAETLPVSFATAAAYGDLAAGILALLSILALQTSTRLALPLVWLFNIVGVADLVNALRQAEAVPHFGATWFIPTFIVPLLLVTHGIIFARLLRGERKTAHS